MVALLLRVPPPGGSPMAKSTFSGARLRAARAAAGIPIERVALDIQRSADSVRSYETGRIDPPASLVARLADSVGVHPGELFDDQVAA
jgi:transcriptional regulator with XRE-family HTH domain